MNKRYWAYNEVGCGKQLIPFDTFKECEQFIKDTLPNTNMIYVGYYTEKYAKELVNWCDDENDIEHMHRNAHRSTETAL